MSEAILNAVPSMGLGDAFRGLGLTRVSFWIQHDPGASVVMWEGRDIETLLERYATSSDPFLARWRGQLRMWSGPEEAERFWAVTRHKVLSWTTGEQAAESEVMIYSDPKQLASFRQLTEDFQQDPSLMGVLDRVRRRQGFTRIETWHQRTGDDDVLLTLVEAHDLKESMAQMQAEANDLDRRIVKVVRSALPPAQLLARWEA